MTSLLESMCSVTMAVLPDASPLQRSKVYPGEATAVSVTCVPERYVPPGGTRVTEPAPAGSTAALREYIGAGVGVVIGVGVGEEVAVGCGVTVAMGVGSGADTAVGVGLGTASWPFS